MTDLPLQRTLKIGNATVGLMGLDVALNIAMQQNLPDEQAVDFLFGEIRRQNYVPSGAESRYRQALLHEYRKLRGQEVEKETKLQIRILGPGCVSCNRLNTMLFEILQAMQLPADIEQIHDLDEIWRHGVLSTPALIINGEVKCAGRMPSPAEVEDWVRDAAA